MGKHSIYEFKFDEMHQLYVTKAERKGRSADEVNEIICWLTGYSNNELHEKIAESVDMETFFKLAPLPNPNRNLITGSICGIKISEIDEPIMKEIRFLDKLVDELAKGKTMDKILRR